MIVVNSLKFFSWQTSGPALSQARSTAKKQDFRTMATVHQLKTWATSQAEEDGMNDGHAVFWRRMIELLAERSLQGRRVLDFGCNQGGLLRMLHQTHGYERILFAF
jgi:2-polyprenyl-3-methyl-5-hydroxy-6-metoxy-1,4-benzoquinol methylase